MNFLNQNLKCNEFLKWISKFHAYNKNKYKILNKNKYKILNKTQSTKINEMNENENEPNKMKAK